MVESECGDSSATGDDVPAGNREDVALTLGSPNAQLAAFPAELAEKAGRIVAQLSEEVDFKHIRSLLEISVEGGAFSRALCERNLELAATIVDAPQAKAQTTADRCRPDDGAALDPPEAWTTEDAGIVIKRPEADGRITCLSCSCQAVWKEVLKIEYDAVLMQLSSASMPEAAIRSLYGKAFQGLRPGGVVLVLDVNADRVLEQTQPDVPQALVVSVEMLAAGFVEFRQMCLCESQGQLLIGRKPLELASKQLVCHER